MRSLVLLGLIALSTGACSSGDVFTFAEDDLCEWVSEEEVTSFVEEAYDQSGVEWAGRAVAVSPRGSAWDLPGVYCTWHTTDGGWIIARGLEPSSFGGPVVEFSKADNDEQLLFPLGYSVSGHPGFADDIIAANAAFGRYGFWVQGSGEALGLELALSHGESEDWAEQEKMLVVVADGFLREMGWTP